jgi:two-component sensor histidine kinase
LHTLLHAIVAPYLDQAGEDANVLIEGEDITIDSNATASLALVLHEFTTNAAKYGALSVSAGRVRIASRAVGGGFELFWAERGGPCLKGPPTKHGFGTVLATKTVEGQLNGTLHYDWQPGGLAITMTVPLERPAHA